MSEKETIKISKFLSLILRHQPEAAGIELDEQGWTNVEILIRQVNLNGIPVSLDILKYVVENNNKSRFAFNEDYTKIRASQGHSVEVELNLKAVNPPTLLFHGTAEKKVDLILLDGLKKQSRNHVHLSSDIETAIIVGRRHGKPAVFEVNAAGMSSDSFQFYLSENKVWLTDHVPSKYLKLIK